MIRYTIRNIWHLFVCYGEMPTLSMGSYAGFWKVKSDARVVPMTGEKMTPGI